MKSCLALAFAGLLSLPAAPVLADDLTPTATVTATPTVQPTDTATPAPTATLLPTPTPTQTPRPRVEPTRETATRPGGRRHRHHRTGRHSTTAPRATATATTTPLTEGRRPKSHHHTRPKATATPTATATPVPALSLSTEDSVKPVTCNRGPAGPAPAPFLVPPYHGWTSIVSYVDHDLPDFVQDGLIITASGLQAAPDQVHQGTGFPAYWNASVRQYLYYDGHNGYDYNVSYQPLYAAAAGKVIFARFEYPDSPDHGYGKMVMIQHRHGYVTLYGHLSKLMVHAGEKVRAGEEIGISGNTGHSTGPHLHFTVFHNCTPTDPYGWSGPGTDPLSAYQGETSEYLWRRAPLIDNPLPGWPGLPTLPASPAQRLVLLRLPSTAGGTDAFLIDLRREAGRAAKALRAGGATVREDLIRGLLEVSGPVSPEAIYRVPGVASISSPDTIEGAKADVLSVLARAALVRPQKPLVVNRARHWSGYLLRWQGRTLLVGRGSKGSQVNLHLSGGRGGSWHRISTDPSTGAYAVDLGPMSARQYQRLRQSLQQPGRRSGATLEPVSIPREPPGTSRGSSAGFPWLLPPILFMVAGVAGVALRRRLRPSPAE